MALALSATSSASSLLLGGSSPHSSSSVSHFGFGQARPPRHRLLCSSFKVEIEHKGSTHALEVEEDEAVLDKALDAGLDVPYDCRLGVCMTCPAKLVSGSVDQSGGMLSDDVIEKGYVLLCVANPKSDCRIRTIPEEELLALQLVTAQH